jgi:hypothetical protein
MHFIHPRKRKDMIIIVVLVMLLAKLYVISPYHRGYTRSTQHVSSYEEQHKDAPYYDEMPTPAAPAPLQCQEVASGP